MIVRDTPSGRTLERACLASTGRTGLQARRYRDAVRGRDWVGAAQRLGGAQGRKTCL